jgi:hypothetical protein
MYDDVHAPFLIEKSPPNAVRTRWLQAHFQPAVFIGIVRNGYAVAEGIRRRAGHDIEVAGEQWARSNEVMLSDWEHLHRARLVRYEDLARESTTSLTDLLTFVGLDADRYPWEDHEASLRIHGRSGTIEDLNQEAISRLTDADRTIIERHAGPMLKRLGYLPGVRA